jgi:hypothetical protein
MKRTLVVVAALLVVPMAALAQKAKSEGETKVEQGTIIAIDHDKRDVTIKDKKDGHEETLHIGPDMKRFAELKVGDVVTFRYYESTVFAVRKPGDPSGLPTETDKKYTRGTGARPGATIAEQATATVTVKAIDTKVPSLSVLTEDGRTTSFKVDDKNAMKDVKVGDTIEITYTEAMVISVK